MIPSGVNIYPKLNVKRREGDSIGTAYAFERSEFVETHVQSTVEGDISLSCCGLLQCAK